MKDRYNVEAKSDLVEDDISSYNSNKDFTSLEAWKKARKVKLFL